MAEPENNHNHNEKQQQQQQHNTATRNTRSNGKQHEPRSNTAPRLSLLTIRKITLTTHILVAIVMGQVKLITQTSFGFTGITLPQLTQHNSTDLTLTQQEATLFGSLRMLGNLSGGLVSGVLVVRLGQRTTMLLGMLFTVASWFVLAFTPVAWLLLCSMFALGITGSLLFPSSGTYTVEVAHEKYRGATFGFTALANSLGVMLPTFIGASGISWRNLALICGTLPLLSLTGVFFLPNSPRWLVSRGRISDARQALSFFRGNHLDTEAELQGIIGQISGQERIGALQQLRLLFKPEIRRRVSTMILISLLYGSSGVFAFQAYLLPILLDLEMDTDPYITAVVYSGLRIVGVVGMLLVVDVLGRKPLLVGSVLASALCFALLGLSDYLPKTGISSVPTWLPFTCVVAHGFATGIHGTVMGTLEGELMPTNCRAVGVLLTQGGVYVTCFLSTWMFPMLLRVVDMYVVFGVFGGICFVLSFLCLALPETKGRTLEQIADTNTEK